MCKHFVKSKAQGKLKALLSGGGVGGGPREDFLPAYESLFSSPQQLPRTSHHPGRSGSCTANLAAPPAAAASPGLSASD